MNCPDDCGGCRCHVKIPCEHCLYHSTAPESLADDEYRERLKEFFFGPIKTYKSLFIDTEKKNEPFGTCPMCGSPDDVVYRFCRQHGYF